MKRFRRISLIVFLALGPLLLYLSGPAAAEEVLPLAVPPPDKEGTDMYPSSYEGNLSQRSLAGAFSGLFKSVLVGRYLDREPAERMAGYLRHKGLTTFVLEKKIEERRLLRNDPVGHFYVVMTGLFGRQEDADILGQRLRAEGQFKDYRILPVDDPGEIEATNAQNLDLYAQSAQVSRDSRQRAEKPLPANSAVKSGEAFKEYVYGRYIGSYRDPLKARDEARRLTAGGWSASVEKDGGWYRVYLAPTDDHRDFKADEATLSSAKRSAASRSGLIFLVDMSGLKGSFTPINPSVDRNDASACAGFSEAGRLGATLNRTIIYIPETSLTVGLIPIWPQKMSWRDIPKRVQAWWNDEKNRPVTKAVYGPAIFNRPEMEKAITGLAPSSEPASLAVGLTETSADLSGIPGKKVLLVFSEFQGPDESNDVRDALNRLKQAHGSSLEVVFIYGDTSGPGYELADSLAREYGPSAAWDGCRLLSDNAYFERYIKTIIR